METSPHRRCRNGASSMHMQDPERIFQEIPLPPGSIFLDLGCGAGDYAFLAARKLKGSGKVVGLDREFGLSGRIAAEASEQGLANVTGVEGDLAERLPWEDGFADVCFLCTVLHSIPGNLARQRLLAEMNRVLRPGGLAAVVECKKEPTRHGPPPEYRISPLELDALARKAGFEPAVYRDLRFNYLRTYQKPLAG